MTTVYTIGHSRHSWEEFRGLLCGAKIVALADLRTSPRSRFPQFNQPVLKTCLEASGIGYHYLGEALGGLLPNGDVADYEAFAGTASFRSALDQVSQIASTARLVIMCSEHEPLHCHRFLLVGRRLAERGVSVNHILRNGAIECHADTEARLLVATRRAQGDLLLDPGERLALAYRAQTATLARKVR